MLCHDLTADLKIFGQEPFVSIFFGGGTPSLMPPDDFKPLFNTLHNYNLINSATEITLEANPGTLDLDHLSGYKALGVNRLSIGVQSFQAHCLKALGRAHSGKQAEAMIKHAQDIGFERINIDLMHGTPGQRVKDAIRDLDKIDEFDIKHLSWYQLTIEKNTIFNRTPPKLPDEIILECTESLGESRIADIGLEHYEISAFAEPGHEAYHNLNYWKFGDYLGIGAGAHGKVTIGENIFRTTRTRHPTHYLKRIKTSCNSNMIDKEQVGLECLMNGLRLKSGISHRAFEERTNLNAQVFRENQLKRAMELNLIEENRFQATTFGWRHLNTLLQMLI